MPSSQKIAAFLEGQHGKLLIIASLAAIATGILNGSYYIDIVVTVGILFILVMALDLVIGYTGQLSLGHNGFFGIGAYLSAILSLNLGLSSWLGLLIGIVVSAIVAFVLSFIVFRTKELYFAIITLAFGMIVMSLTIAFYSITEGSMGLGGIKPISIGDFSFDTGFRMALLVWAAVIAVFWISSNVVKSRVGRALRTIHDDEVAAAAMGVNLMKYKVKVFVLSAVFASIAGSLYVHYRGAIGPGMIGPALMIESLLMLFLGGAGTLWGGLLGVVLLKVLPQLGTVIDDYKIFVYAVVFILILFFLPKGLVGVFQNVATRQKRRAGPAPPSQVKISAGQVLAEVRENGPVRQDPRRPAATNGHALAVDNLCRHFGGLQAVADLSFYARHGTIQSLIGPNGAGKSTVLNLISGIYEAHSGEIRFLDKCINGLRPDEIAGLGIGRTFQVPRLFDNMTLLENVMVGHHTRTSTELFQAAFLLRSAREEEKSVSDDAMSWLERVGLASQASASPSLLSHGQKRWLELARVLASRPKLLLLDEPTSGLNETEKHQFRDFLLELKANGIATVLVEHDMNFVMGISDYIVVINYGRKLAEGLPQEIQENEDVIRAYLG